ncbi:MAG: hypothetical protein HQ483_17620 [Rhodospirillales bacterium]|nr:hypothetical protein [Rhodospirillales bacterium]
MRLAVALLVLSVSVFGLAAKPGLAASEFEKFYGHYVGTSTSDPEDETDDRTSEVTIKPHKGGFNVTWSTTSTRANNSLKKSTFSINFRASKQPGVYGSAMVKDVFGHEKPLDPLNGDPYVWAFIDGDTLTVNSLLVSENGGYEIQTYKRTLTDDGLSLVFSRVQNGQIKKQFLSDMKKVK